MQQAEFSLCQPDTRVQPVPYSFFPEVWQCRPLGSQLCKINLSVTSREQNVLSGVLLCQGPFFYISSQRNTEATFVWWPGKFPYVTEKNPNNAAVNPSPKNACKVGSQRTKQTQLLPKGGKLSFYSGVQNELVWCHFK